MEANKPKGKSRSLAHRFTFAELVEHCRGAATVECMECLRPMRYQTTPDVPLKRFGPWYCVECSAPAPER